MDRNILPNTLENFFVRSKHKLWPITSFQVPHETYIWDSQIGVAIDKDSVLTKAEGQGRMLDVLGIGMFLAYWHLACDSKTIKWLRGLKMEANNLNCGICYSQARVKESWWQEERLNLWWRAIAIKHGATTYFPRFILPNRCHVMPYTHECEYMDKFELSQRFSSQLEGLASKICHLGRRMKWLSVHAQP